MVVLAVTDLNEHQKVSILHDYINLASATVIVAGQQGQALSFQVLHCHVLGSGTNGSGCSGCGLVRFKPSGHQDCYQEKKSDGGVVLDLLLGLVVGADTERFSFRRGA